jgi:hypothetical protein
MTAEAPEPDELDTDRQDPVEVDTDRWAPSAAPLPFVAPPPAPTGGRLDGGFPARRADPEDPASVPAYLRAWRWWMAKVPNIVRIQNKVFAWLAFHLGLVWVATWFRITRQDRLDRTTRPIGATGWHPRDKPIDTDPRAARRPF